jgi:hypothetical protein
MTNYAELTWVTAICILGVYEVYALSTGHITLSRTVWNVDRSQYGALVPFLSGMLAGHFFWSGN